MTIHSNKSFRRLVSLLLCVLFGVSFITFPVAPAHARSGTPATGRELADRQRRNMRVAATLEKGRAEREKHNYRAARRHGERALSLDPDSEAAKAFLEYLDHAEKSWERHREKLREKKESQKRSREEKKKAERVEREKDIRKEPPPPKKEAVKIHPEEEPGTKEAIAPDAPVERTVIPETPDAVPSKEREADISDFARPGHSIVVDGDKVEYFDHDGVIIAEGNVVIQYGEILLECDRIEINTRTRVALCEGNVTIRHPEGVLTGDRIRYDLAANEGEIIGGEVKAFPWFGRAAETGKVGPNEYILRDGFITTCDHDKPHYHLKAGEIRVFPDDKVIARNVVYYIDQVPVLWVPYYYHPIVDTKAKVQFVPGVTSDWGYFLLSAWRFHIKGNTKVDGLLDYRTKKGFAGGANLYYDLGDFEMRALGRGLFRIYYIAQNDVGTYDPKPFRDEGTKPVWRDRIQWKHRIDFDPETVGMLELNKMSDENVLKDYFYNEYEENDPVPPNYISLISSKPNYVFSLEANKRLDDFYTVVQRLPEVKIDVFDQRLWETPFYYSSRTSATYFEKEYAFLRSPAEKVGRLDTFHKLSYATGIGPLSIVPYGTFRETIYSRTKDSAQPAMRSIFGGGVDTFVRFHRIYDLETEAWGLDIDGLRHIIAPRTRYYYTYRPSIGRNTLYEMDEIDSLEDQNGIAVFLENKLQTKRGKEGNKATIDLVRSMLYSDYSVRQKEGGPRFRTLGSELEIRPYDWFYLDNRLEVNGENFALKTNSIEGVFKPWDNFQMALGYRYEKRPGEPRNQITFDASWLINPKWRVGLYERFDIQNSRFEEQQLSITRDLHCWEVTAVYSVKGDHLFKDDFTFWMALRLKAFPDLPIGLSRAYEKRAPGSTSLASPYADAQVPLTP